MYVLPAFWHVETRRWIDWKEITPIPDGAHGLRQIWNVNCFNCHATNLAQGFDPATRRYETTWTEMGIGCEACHGPGRKHVALMDAWNEPRIPSLKPWSERSKTFSSRNGSPRQSFDTCAYCHGNKQNVFSGFRGRRSLRGLRAAFSDQRADSRERSARASSGRTGGPTDSTARRR